MDLQFPRAVTWKARGSYEAHAPLDHVFTMQFSTTSNDVQLQMYMFMNRLTGTQIGFSAMKMFLIDKSCILTVAGMMVTYFVILVQFKMPYSPECHCNITGLVSMDNGSVQIVPDT